MALNVQIFDQEVTRLGIVDVVTALTWKESYNDCGSFELWCPLNDHNAELLREGNLVWIGGDSAGVIEFKELNSDSEGIETIHITGRLIESYLEYRTIMPTIAIEGTVSTVISKLLTDNAVNPKTTSRKIPLLTLKSDQESLGETVFYQRLGGDLLSEVTGLCQANALGFRIKFLPRIPRYEFELYKGVNRTIDQTAVDPVLFSSDLDDILESTYSHNTTETKTVAYVAGDTDDVPRLVQAVGNFSGLERRELFVDASSIDSSAEWEIIGTITYELLNPQQNNIRITISGTATNKSTGEIKSEQRVRVEYNYDLAEEMRNNDEESRSEPYEETVTRKYPETEYRGMLSEQGKISLEKYKDIETFNATIRSFGVAGYEYGVDYFLGDTVTVYDKKLRVKTAAVVTAVTRTFDGEGDRLDVTFGYEQPTIASKLRRYS